MGDTVSQTGASLMDEKFTVSPSSLYQKDR